MNESNQTIEELTTTLTMAVKHMRHRLRSELGADSTGFTMTQLTILWHLHRLGPSTITALAAAEGISQQAVSQLIPPLKDEGLVAAAADPDDGRKTLLTLTPKGLNLRESLLASRNEWLSKVLAAHTTEKERRILQEAMEILERLANVKATNY